MIFHLEYAVCGRSAAKADQLSFQNRHFRRLEPYTGKPLKDFMRESNRGRDVFFLSRREKK